MRVAVVVPDHDGRPCRALQFRAEADLNAATQAAERALLDAVAWAMALTGAGAERLPGLSLWPRPGSNASAKVTRMAGHPCRTFT